jgi:hypothetical protein
MDKPNAEKLVSQAFNFPFDENKYSELISNIFKTTITKKEDKTDILDKFKEIINTLNIFTNIKDQNNKKIDVIEVELKDNISFDKSRYIQQNIARYYLKKNDCNAVLISFHNKNSDDWRFSLVTREVEAKIDSSGSIKINIKTSPIKRLSYLVGRNEPNFTAKSQILNLLVNDSNNLEDIKNAFNLEQVTEDFFEDYKNLFIELSKEIEKLIKSDKKINEEFKSKNIKPDNFAKKLLGQIVFLYFLQKKGWLGVEKNENGNFKKWGYGSKTFLQDLFEKYKKKKIKTTNFFNNLLEPIFYDALNNEEEYYEKLNCKIPFLNGGLFKPFHEYNWSETELNINDDLIEKIFSVFNKYNFTVQEDQDFDADVAVDPEMLGKVFENLLPENFKKGQGSYYTPRIVVTYMCKSSIKNYLINSLKKRIKENYLDKLINLNFFNNEEIDELNKCFSKDELKIIDELLNKIKICDPAIGSGAFPVQFMNEIVNIRFNISELADLKHTYYELKRNFIENSIYGVDIDSSAIEIAKLRLWLSLVVDEKSFETINPLPNLDYKILQGNSLIEKYKNFDFSKLDQTNELFEDIELSNAKKELINIQKEYFNSSSRKKSKKLQELLNEKIQNLIIKQTKNKNINENFLSLIEDRNFFFWKIFFLDVFDKGGFDVVIGNPPYVFARSSELKGFTDENKKYYSENFKLTKYKLNTYSLFVELGSKILKKEGVLSFIIPTNWMTINNNLDLRKFVLNKDNIEITNFSKKVFKNADVDVAILNFNNFDNQNNLISIFEEQNNIIILRAKNNASLLRDEDYEFIINFDVLEDENLKIIAKKINLISSPLNYYSKVKSGIMSYEEGKGDPKQNREMIKNRIYHSNKSKNENYYKYLDGENVKRYSFDWNKQYILYGKNLAAPRSFNLFSTNRILVRQIPSLPPYCISASIFTETYINDRNSMNIIEIEKDIYTILGILNSKLITFWFIIRFAKLQRDLFPQFKVNELEKFPICKDLDKNSSKKISDLVKNKIKNPDNIEIDEEIDNQIYAKYKINKTDKTTIENYLKNFN